MIILCCEALPFKDITAEPVSQAILVEQCITNHDSL